MQAPEHFEQLGTRGFYRPVCTATFEQAVEQIAAVIQHARKLGLSDLLVNTSGYSGFEPPTTFGRYALAVRWAGVGGGALRIAMVARPELIDPQKIAVVMAQNRGLHTDVFSNEPDAIKWLDARTGIRP